ncbi:MAG: HTH domain-containing protein [Erysipelotrichaceae bacterium]
MRKSTRLNDMMIFLNNRTYFNLRDIMEEYGISKSTALRDIQALEEIGMPIYSEHGRNGRYGILKNRLLSPIIFTVDEMYALYFAMLTLNAYESTPFHLSVEKLKEKFEICLSNELIGNIHKMESVLKFEETKHYNSSPFLKEILQSILENTVCKVVYKKEGKRKLFQIQFLNISSSFGQWYVTGFNFDTQRTQVLRCDKIVDILKSDVYNAKPIEELLNSSTNIFKSRDATDFEVHISSKGVDLFQKENYPSMELHCINGQYIIKGFYNKGEELFIADYFIPYGKYTKSIRPIQFKKLLQDRLCELSQHYQML